MKWGTNRTVLAIINAVAFIFLLIVGLKMVFKWDLSEIFMALLLVLVGIWLFGQSMYYSLIKGLKAGRWKAFFHSITFAFAWLFLYLGIISFPALGFLRFTAVTNFTGIIVLLGSIDAVLEMWID